MRKDLAQTPEYRDAMTHLMALQREMEDGMPYWMAREIHPVLGYPVWDKFQPVIERAKASLQGNGLDPSQHIALTSKMVGLGSNAQREVDDYFLTRAACYLIAMNGDPSKPEIAAAQAYFVAQTDRMEQADAAAADAKRLDLRQRVTKSFRAVSAVAQDAGITGKRQALFHNARYLGLYGMHTSEVRARKGLKDGEALFDRAGSLELAAHDLQMLTAANAIEQGSIRGEQAVINKNREVGQRVRDSITQSGATPPEDLALEAPISEVRKRVKAQTKLAKH